jgi:hypothetical protein
MDIFAGLVEVFLVDFGEGGDLGWELLELEFVALALGFQKRLVLVFEVVDVGLGGLVWESQFSLQVLNLLLLFLQPSLHYRSILLILILYFEVLFPLSIHILCNS